MSPITWLLLTYIVGLITTFIVCKLIDDNGTWYSTMVRLMLTLLSWVGMLMVVFTFVLNKLEDDEVEWINKEPSKPWRWL